MCVATVWYERLTGLVCVITPHLHSLTLLVDPLAQARATGAAALAHTRVAPLAHSSKSSFSTPIEQHL